MPRILDFRLKTGQVNDFIIDVTEFINMLRHIQIYMERGIT